jgi:hypothetical protein
VAVIPAILAVVVTALGVETAGVRVGGAGDKQAGEQNARDVAHGRLPNLLQAVLYPSSGFLSVGGVPGA